MKQSVLGVWSAVALFGAVLGITTSTAASRDEINKSFNVTGGGSLQMEVDRGSIKIQGGTGSKVEVSVVREHRGSQKDATTAFAMHKVDLTADGNRVLVKSKADTKLGSKNALNKMSVTYTITTPTNFTLNLKTAGGNLWVADVAGAHHLQTSGGNIELRDIGGEKVAARTAGGNIKATNCNAPLDAQTSGGNIQIDQSNGNLNANTSGGNISIEGATGKVTAKTSGGSIRVERLTGSVEAMSHGGDVRAQLLAPPNGACTLKTSGGNVEIGLAANSAFDVNARTSAGRVSTEFGGQPANKFSQSSLNTKVNGGGPLITLESSAGNVKIRKI